MSGLVKNDLDYLRDLAEAGAHAPLLGGRFLAWWGGIITIAYSLHYAIASGLAGLAPSSVGIMWMAVMAVGLGGYFALSALFPRDKPGAGSAGNRADIVWLAGGLSIFAFFAGSIPAILLGRLDPIVFNFSLPLVFSVYACGLLVTGVLARNRLMQAAAGLALVTVAATAFLASTNAAYLAAAVGVFASVFLPGIALLRAEPKSVV